MLYSLDVLLTDGICGFLCQTWYSQEYNGQDHENCYCNGPLQQNNYIAFILHWDKKSRRRSKKRKKEECLQGEKEGWVWMGWGLKKRERERWD